MRSICRTTGSPTAKMTVNAGLRYDYMTPAFEADNRMSNYDGAAGIVQAKDGRVADRGW